MLYAISYLTFTDVTTIIRTDADQATKAMAGHPNQRSQEVRAMALRRWYPIRDVRRFDSLADRFWRGYGVGSEVAYRSLPLDVVHEGEDILVHASVPGIAPEDIQVSIEDGCPDHRGRGQDRARERRRELSRARAWSRKAPPGPAVAGYGRRRQCGEPLRERGGDGKAPQDRGQEGQEAECRGRPVGSPTVSIGPEGPALNAPGPLTSRSSFPGGAISSMITSRSRKYSDFL